MKTLRCIKNTYLSASLLLIIIGALFVVFSDQALRVICIITGAALTVFGVIKIVGYFSKDLYKLAFQFDLALGAVLILIGVLMIVKPSSIETLIVLLGAFLLFDGAFKIQTAADAKKFGIKSWGMFLLFAVATMICGLILIFSPFEAATVMLKLLGISIIIDGIQNIFITAYTVKATKNAEKLFGEEEER